ncbi:unnamed protein product [Prunus armeniaca]
MATSAYGSNSSFVAPMPNVSNMLTVKLECNTYPLWLANCATSSQPLSYEVNPAFEDWIQQDQMGLSWLNGSLSPAVLATVTHSTSVHLTWLSLEKHYTSQIQNRLLQLHCDLLQTTRGDLSIADFLDKVNSLVDNLALSCSPCDSDLRGTTMVASHGHGGFHGRGSFGQRGGRGFSGGSFFHGGRGSFSSSTDGVLGVVSSSSNGVSSSFSSGASSSSMAPGPTAFPSGSRILCQICGRGGHAALDCYNRMNLAFEGRIPT